MSLLILEVLCVLKLEHLKQSHAQARTRERKKKFTPRAVMKKLFSLYLSLANIPIRSSPKRPYSSVSSSSFPLHFSTLPSSGLGTFLRRGTIVNINGGLWTPSSHPRRAPAIQVSMLPPTIISVFITPYTLVHTSRTRNGNANSLQYGPRRS